MAAQVQVEMQAFGMAVQMPEAMAALALSRNCVDTVCLDWVLLSPADDSNKEDPPDSNQPTSSPTETNRSDLLIEMKMHSSIRYN